MEIRTSEGTQHVTSQSQGALNTVLGAIGTAGTLFGGGMASNWFGGRGFGRGCGEWNGQGYGYGYGGRGDALFGHCAVTEAEMGYFQQSMQKDQEIARKDSEIALLRSENFTNTKIVDAYTALAKEIRRVEDKVDANHEAQSAINLHQATHNANVNGAVRNLSEQIAQLQAVTKLFVPASNVCRKCCDGDGEYEAA